jgi:hypothetical protein
MLNENWQVDPVITYKQIYVPRLLIHADLKVNPDSLSSNWLFLLFSLSRPDPRFSRRLIQPLPIFDLLTALPSKQ